MIYVTGDMHGDVSRFRRRPIRTLKKGDTLIVCGDFGFVFDGSDKEKRLLKWLGGRRYNILFVEGVHDNLNLISSYPEEDWNGGKARRISGNLRHLSRGHIFNIEGMSILAFGGGESPSLEGMLEWWERLLPSPEELDDARSRLKKSGGAVDYIVSHQCSRKLKRLLTMEETDINVLDTFFDYLRENVRYKCWFFGGYHIDRFIPPSEAALYEEAVCLSQPIKMSNAKTSKRSIRK